MGDVVMQSSFVRWLRQINPQAKISFLTSKEFGSLVSELEEIDEVLLYERMSGLKDIKQIIQLSKRLSDVDFVFDLHANTRTKLLSLFMLAPFLKVDKRSTLRKILVNTKKDFLTDTSTQHFRTIEDFSFLSGLPIEKEDLYRTQGVLSKTTLTKIRSDKSSYEKSIVISPVASFESKRWPMDKYQELINLISSDKAMAEFKIKIIAGPGDKYCADLGLKNNQVENLQGKTSLKETIEEISKAMICVTNDTGSLHIAESFGVPTAAIFGPTSPSFGFKPHLKESKVFWSGISCSPCSTTGSKNCHRDQLYCMLEIEPYNVYSYIREILSSDLYTL